MGLAEHLQGMEWPPRREETPARKYIPTRQLILHSTVCENMGKVALDRRMTVMRAWTAERTIARHGGRDGKRLYGHTGVSIIAIEANDKVPKNDTRVCLLTVCETRTRPSDAISDSGFLRHLPLRVK